MIQVYEIDEQGFFKRDVFIRSNADYPSLYVEVGPPTHEKVFYKPKWTGTEWIEGATQEEIEEITKPQPQPLTDTEILGQQMTERELEAILQGQQITDVEIRVRMLEMGANPL